MGVYMTACVRARYAGPPSAGTDGTGQGRRQAGIDLVRPGFVLVRVAVPCSGSRAGRTGHASGGMPMRRISCNTSTGIKNGAGRTTIPRRIIHRIWPRLRIRHIPAVQPDLDPVGTCRNINGAVHAAGLRACGGRICPAAGFPKTHTLTRIRRNIHVWGRLQAF